LSQMDTKEALTLLGRNLSKEEYPKQLMIPYQDGYKTIDVKQLLYLKAEVNYTTLFIEGLGPLLITKTLKSFEELLDNEQFIRIHKSYIINLAYVKEVKKSEKHFIFMKNEEELPIARRRLSYVLDKILLK